MKRVSQILAVFLSLLLIIESIPVSSAIVEKTVTQQAAKAESADEAIVSKPEILYEITDDRTATTKSFMQSDGTKLIVQYKEAVHYENADGEFVEYDNTLTETETDANKKEYKTKDSDVDIRISKKTNGNKLVRVKKGDDTLSWSFSDISKVTGKITEKTADEDAASLENFTSEVIFSDVFRETDLQYIIFGDSLKENIILNGKDAPAEFEIEYKYSGLSPVLSADKKSILLNNSDNETVFVISAPFMTDSNGEENTDLYYELGEVKNNQFTATLICDRNWLDDEDRKYPVTVDPVIITEQTWDNSDYQSAYISSYLPDACFGRGGANYEGSLYVGYEYTSQAGRRDKTRSLIRFSLPSLNKGDRVVGATMLTYLNACYPATTVNLYRVTSSWSQGSVTWNSQPSIDSVISEYKAIPYTETYEADFIEWDITKLVNSWYIGTASNYGIMLMSPAENSTSTHRARFYSSGYTSASAARPLIAISVRNMTGYEDYYSYSEFNAGTAGTAYINDFTGNLMFAHNDIGTSGVLMPVSVSNIYNTTTAGVYPKTYPHVGYGKKLSLLQTLKPSSEYGLTGDSAASYPYAYEDGDGTVHYFYKTTENGTVKYYDEDGLNLNLTLSDSEYTVTDKQGNKKIFDRSDGKIKKDTNADGVSVIYNYTAETLSSGKTRTFLSSVTDGAGHIINLYYDKESGRLTSMKGPDGNSISYTYIDGYNTKITYSDGSSSTYTYSSGFLTSAKSSDGYLLTFTYTSDSVKAVDSVTEKGGTATGDYVKITRNSPYQTEIRNSGLDRTYGNSDDIKTTYQFDTYGRVASAKTALGSGEVISYGSYDFTMGAQNNATDIKKRNRLESASAVGKNANNLLINHSFEVVDDGNWTAGYWLSSSYSGSSAALSTEAAYLGQQSMKINISSATATGGYGMYQSALNKVQAGKTYTASVYVKTQSVTKMSGAASAGAGLVVKAVGSSGTTNVYSDLLTGTTSTAVDNGWQRVEVTFSAPSGITSLRIMPVIYCATGTAYFDCIQLEEGTAANNYNLLKHSGFEISSSGWHVDNSESSDILSTAAHNTGSKSFLINGATDKAKALRQTVGVSSNEDDTYIVSGFAKAAASPGSSENNERLFAISVKIWYTDGTSKTKYPAYFNYAVTDWQYVSGVFTLSDEDSSTQKTPESVTVYYNYRNQTNICYFDDLCLIKEPVPTYKYDSDGNLISAVENAEKTSSLTYDANDNLTALKDEKNVNYTYTYSSSVNPHRLTSATDNFTGIKYNFTYNTNGSLTVQDIQSESGTEAIKTEIVYSSAGDGIAAGAYLYRDRDEHGRSTFYNYNKLSGLLDSVEDANGYVTNYTYNQNNGLLTNVQNGNSSVSYGYDNSKTKLTGITRAGGNYGFTYDSFGNPLTTSVAGTTLITNTYSAGNGPLLLSTYGNSDKRYYTYDAPGRLIGIKNNNTNVYSWTYSGSGVPNTYTDNISGRKYNYTYDSLGRIISQTGKNISDGSAKTSSTYTYDISNNLTKLTTFAGDISLSMRYYYDSVNRPTKSYYTSNTQETYTYDALGRLSASSLKLTSGSLAKSYIYHNSANYSGKTTSQIKDELIGDRGYRYTYDRVGNITSIKEKTTAGGSFTDKVSYTYDNLNQLTRENNKDLNKTITYSYDGNGNITSVKEYTYTTGSVSSLTPTKTINYTYDGTWKDKLVNYNGQAITYDSIGNPLTYRGGMTFSWFGRQMESANVNGTAITYKYNADGLRTEKTVGSTVSKYEYTGDKLFYEKRGDLEFYYRYDAFGNIASISRAKSDGTSFALYTVCNSRGDVEELRRSTGELFARYVYDSWGNVLHIYDANGAEITSTANFAVQNPFRYRGYYYDNETGLYYVGSRYYDPVTCRFLNADSQVAGIGGDILGYNMFAYCFNNPVNMDDSDGEWPSWATKVLIGTAVIAAAAVLTVATAGTGTALACFAVGALKGALIGAAVGAATGAATGAIEHRVSTGSWEGADQAALEGAANGYMSGAVTGFISGGLTSNVCFVAGTSVLTSVGQVAIENIKSGDYVWARNPETGEQALKRVVQTFENETTELITITVASENIVCTKEHPFYLPEKGWVAACQLRAGDILVTVNGEFVVVEKIQHEILETPVKVYNFEVEEFHTYFVSCIAVLVHNLCKPYNQLKQTTKGTGQQAHHIIEKRFAEYLNLNKGKMLSTPVTPTQHQAFTNAWRQAIPYKSSYDINKIWNAAQSIYSNNAELLEAARITLFGG